MTKHTIRPSPAETRHIKETLLEGIAGRERLEDVDLPRYSLSFLGEIKVRRERTTTGVKFLGEEEHFTKRLIFISGFRIGEATDDEGNRLKVELDPRELHLETEEDTLSIHISYAERPESDRGNDSKKPFFGRIIPLILRNNRIPARTA